MGLSGANRGRSGTVRDAAFRERLRCRASGGAVTPSGVGFGAIDGPLLADDGGGGAPGVVGSRTVVGCLAGAFVVLEPWSAALSRILSSPLLNSFPVPTPMVAPAAAAACSSRLCAPAGDAHNTAAAIQAKYDFMANRTSEVAAEGSREMP